ncbi:MAG TPA: hypothetical protein VJQ83_08185 [Tepidiformaceae bacterium]|nr:hypothetical protein [Tepidiformaceae bacterium]
MAKNRAAPEPNAPMLFAFRGIRVFQVVLAIVALVTGLGAVFLARAVADGNGSILIIPGIILLFVFGWSFMGALRAPTSFVAITDERTRIRFAGFVDTVVATPDITSAQAVRWNILGGIGIRTNFGGKVALVTAAGTAVEIRLRNPIRVSVIPGLLRVKADRLTLSVKNPQRMVERFAR